MFPFYLRIALMAVFLCFGALASSCGGDSSAKPTVTSAVTKDTPLPPLPTATPVAEDGPALSIALNGGKSIVPTVTELKAMPATEIKADGTKKGVTIAALAKQVDAKDGATVTIKGVRADGKTIAFVRKPLSEIGATTVLVIDAQNHLSIASSSLAKAEWLQAVESVSFANSN